MILVLANYNPALSYWYLFFQPLEDSGLVIFKYAVLTLVSCQPYKTKSACYKVEIYLVFYLLSCYCVCDYYKVKLSQPSGSLWSVSHVSAEY